jgi:hypothetical protein
MTGLSCGCRSTSLLLQLVKTGLSLTHADGTINVFTLSITQSDLKVFSLWTENI